LASRIDREEIAMLRRFSIRVSEKIRLVAQEFSQCVAGLQELLHPYRLELPTCGAPDLSGILNTASEAEWDASFWKSG
jgi:hypothetical protein